jgi:hypothetical protein
MLIIIIIIIITTHISAMESRGTNRQVLAKRPTK